jgi:hypothetical protein
MKRKIKSFHNGGFRCEKWLEVDKEEMVKGSYSDLPFGKHELPSVSRMLENSFSLS